jgi:hypothetical protein
VTALPRLRQAEESSPQRECLGRPGQPGGRQALAVLLAGVGFALLGLSAQHHQLPDRRPGRHPQQRRRRRPYRRLGRVRVRLLHQHGGPHHPVAAAAATPAPTLPRCSRPRAPRSGRRPGPEGRLPLVGVVTSTSPARCFHVWQAINAQAYRVTGAMQFECEHAWEG